MRVLGTLESEGKVKGPFSHDVRPEALPVVSGRTDGTDRGKSRGSRSAPERAAAAVTGQVPAGPELRLPSEVARVADGARGLS